MGVLERLEKIVKANLNDLLEKTANPEKILEQLISDMQSELADARDQLAAAIREGKRLRALCAENEQLAEKWQKKAILAVQYSKDNLAREAILRKRSAMASAEDYRRESGIHEEATESLKSALNALEAKIQEAKRKKEELIARKRKAEISQLLRRNISDKMSVFGRMESKITSLDAEARALEALNRLDSNELITRQREEELEAELAKLKEKLKNGGS